jgi:hypothetical protein
MADSIPNLHLLDRARVPKDLDLASELFHRINRIIPQDQVVLTVPPNRLVRDAVALMSKKGYSQVPVVDLLWQQRIRRKHRHQRRSTGIQTKSSEPAFLFG